MHELDMERSLSENLAVVEWDAIPAAAIRAARRELLWFLGTAVAGASAPGSRNLRDYAVDFGCPAQASILGYGDRTIVPLAGFVNATYAKALEYEDKIWIGNTHGYGVGMAVVPAVLAAAEAIRDVSGNSLLTAISAATDLHARLILAPRDATFGKTGWNPAYLFSCFGAAAGAAKVMGLDADGIQNALGLAYAQAAGNYQGHIEGVLGIRLQLGFGVRNGIMAAELAARGFTGVHQFLNGRYGLFNQYFAGLEVDTESIIAGLGSVFKGERIGFKGYPCGLVIHPALDALQPLRGSFDPSDVVGVQITGDEHLRIMCEPEDVRHHPNDSVEAQFSAPWAVACTILDGRVGLRHFSDDVLAKNEYRRLAELVSIQLEPGRGSSRVEIRLADGRVLRSADVTQAKGHPDNPLSDEDISEIVAACLAFGPGNANASAASHLAEMILTADPLPSVSEIMAVLGSFTNPTA
jgi:2-methylcitrate dehydratase PrpD